MKAIAYFFIISSILLVFAWADAAAMINDETMIESNGSDEMDGSIRNKKDTSFSNAQQIIPSPLRRHHMKFGVLGKRYSYGYLGKRSNEARLNDEYEDWLHDVRERRAGRPQYGMLG